MTSSKRPWWQTTTTPKYGFVLGAFWTLLAAFEWITIATGGASNSWGGVRAVLAPLMTLVGVAYLVSAIRLRRRLRADRPDESRAE